MQLEEIISSSRPTSQIPHMQELDDNKSLLKKAKKFLIDNTYDMTKLRSLDEFKDLNVEEIKKLKDFKKN